VLAEAHDAGLVHGGVTPSNVLERPSGQPALADFGMALRLRFPRDLTGDAAYTAPEVLREGELSEAADVYGLGAVLYLALTGRSPFPARPGESADDVVLRVLREPPAEVTDRDVPPALSRLLLRMLAKEPDARPEAAAVAGEFEALLTEGPEKVFRHEVVAGRSVPLAVIETPKASGGGKSRKTLLIGAGAAVALVAVVSVVFRPGDDDPRTAQLPPAATPSRATPEPPAAPAIKLNPPVDKGTSVVLTWSYPKKLTYAVVVAEQGAERPQTTLRGNLTTMTVQVSAGLKYCFLVQGTDGAAKFKSAPMPIRGATCSK